MSFKVISNDENPAEEFNLKQQRIQSIMNSVGETVKSLTESMEEARSYITKQYQAGTLSEHEFMEHHKKFAEKLASVPIDEVFSHLHKYLNCDSKDNEESYSNLLSKFHEFHFHIHEIRDAVTRKCDNTDCDYNPGNNVYSIGLSCPLCTAQENIPSTHHASSLFSVIVASVSGEHNLVEMLKHPLILGYISTNSEVYNELEKLVNNPSSLSKFAKIGSLEDIRQAKIFYSKVDSIIKEITSIDSELSSKLSSFLFANLDSANLEVEFNTWVADNIPSSIRTIHAKLHDCYLSVSGFIHCPYC